MSIFKRLNSSFLLLILTTAIFLTFFSFYKYSDEISDNIDRYASLLVQNVKMKIQDSLEAYETEALAFYDNSQVIAALQENAALARRASIRKMTGMPETGTALKTGFITCAGIRDIL